MVNVTAALAAIPVVGALVFVTFALLAMHVDLAVQRTESLGRRVMIRPWSIVSDDPREAGHWFMLMAAISYATVVPATALWQVEVAPTGQNHTQLVVAACIAATGFFFMALVPHRDSRTASTVTYSAIFHTATAGIYLAAGCAHAICLVFIAEDTVEGAALLAVRAVLGSLMLISVMGMLFGALYLYFMAAIEFNTYYYPAVGEPKVEALPAERDLALRRQMALLAILQSVYGLSYAGLVASSAAEVQKLKGGALPGGIVCCATLVTTSLLAFGTARLSHNVAGGDPSVEVECV